MHKVLIVNNYQEIVEESPLKIENFTLTPLEWLIKVRDPEQETIILLNLKRDIRKIRSDAKLERYRMIEEATKIKQNEIVSVNNKIKEDIREETQPRQVTEVKPLKKMDTPQLVVELTIQNTIQPQKIVTTPVTRIEEVKQHQEVSVVVEVKQVLDEKKLTPPPTPPVEVIKKQVEEIVNKPAQPPAQIIIPEKKVEKLPQQVEKPLVEQSIIIEPANNSIKKSLTSKKESKKNLNSHSSISKPVVIQNETQSRLKHSLIDFGSTEDRQLCEMSIDDSIQFDESNMLDNKTFREHLEKTSKLLEMIRDNSPPPLIPEDTHEQHKKSFHDSLYERSNTQLNNKLQPNQKNKLDIQANKGLRDTKTPVDKSKSPAFQKLIKKPNYANTNANTTTKPLPEAQLSISPPQSKIRKNVNISPQQKLKPKVNAVNKSIKERSIENSPKRGSENKRSTHKINQNKSVSTSPQINIKPVKIVQKPKEINKVDKEKPVIADAIIKQKNDNVQKPSPKKEVQKKQVAEPTVLKPTAAAVPPQSVRSISVTQTSGSARAASIIKIAPIKLPVSKPSLTPSLDASVTPKYTPSDRLGTKRSPPPAKLTTIPANSDYQDFVKSAIISQKGGDSPSMFKNKQTKIRIIKKTSPERSIESASPRRTAQANVNYKTKFESEWFSSIMQQEFQKENSNGQKVDQIKQYLQNTRAVSHNLKRKSPKGSPRKNQSLEQRDSILNESVALGNDTQDSIAGRTLETDFFEDTERPSGAVQSRYQKEGGLDVKYNPADKYRNFKKQRTVQQSSKQNRTLTIQDPPIESQSINLSKINQQQDGPPQDDIKRFFFNRSGTKQIKDGQNNDKNDIFRQLSPSSRAQSSPKALRQLNPLNQVFMPGDQLQVPQMKLPDFKKKFTMGNATTAINTNNNQISQDTFKSSLMKTDIFQPPRDEIIVMNVDVESQRDQGVNPLSQISMRPQTKILMSPGGDLMTKKRGGQRLEPINNNKRAQIFGNMKNHDKVMTIAAKEGLTYPDISVNFSDANNNNSIADEPIKKFGQVTPFLQYVQGAGGTAYPRASSHLSKTEQRITSINNKLADLGEPKKIKRRQIGQGISQTKNESPKLSMFFQDSIRGGSMIEDFHSTVKRDISPLTASGHSKFVYPLINGCGSQGAAKANGLLLPNATERKNASTLREAKTANKYFQTSQLMKKNQRSPSPNSAQQNQQQQYFQNYDISVVNCYFLKAPATLGSSNE